MQKPDAVLDQRPHWGQNNLPRMSKQPMEVKAIILVFDTYIEIKAPAGFDAPARLSAKGFALNCLCFSDHKTSTASLKRN